MRDRDYDDVRDARAGGKRVDEGRRRVDSEGRAAPPRRSAENAPPRSAAPRRSAENAPPRSAAPRRRAEDAPPRSAAPRRRAEDAPMRSAQPRRAGGATPPRSAAPRKAASTAPVRRAPRYHDDDDDQDDRAARRRKAPRRRRTSPVVVLAYWLVAIALAFTASYFIHEYGFQVVRVSGDAMYETMCAGDLALMTKFDYKARDPERGDIVAFRLGAQKGVLLRRLVGLPGETIELIDGKVLRDGSEMLEQYVSLRNYSHFAAKTAPPGKYYVLGDNRSEVSDSRASEIGLIDRADITGRVRAVIWPLNHWSTF